MPQPYSDWGLTHYNDAFNQQKIEVQNRIDNTIQDTLFFTEHHPVYTLGTRKDTENNLLWNEPQLIQKGISIAKTNRGGDITYHGPGQIVGYPIISLQKSKDLHLYLRNLEQTLINALNIIGLPTTRNPGKTGIWIQDRKIAAIGVAVRRWVTYHGFALNICPDLSHFQGIIPCGIPQQEGSVTSLNAELPNHGLSLHEIKSIIATEFWKLF